MRILFDSKLSQFKTPFGTLKRQEVCTLHVMIPCSCRTTAVNTVCERKTHKSIIIGTGGEKLKAIASAARAELEQMLGCKVNLQCWIKVKEDWRNNQYLIRNYGYE